MELLSGFLFGIGIALGLIAVWIIIFVAILLIDKFK